MNEVRFDKPPAAVRVGRVLESTEVEFNSQRKGGRRKWPKRALRSRLLDVQETVTIKLDGKYYRAKGPTAPPV